MFPKSIDISTKRKSINEMSINWKHKSVLNLINEEHDLNPIEAIRKRAADFVLKALESGWSGPPYNPLELAKILRFELEPKDTLSFDARIIPNKKSYRIEYNPFQKQSRINFSIAHEIAHTLFTDCSEEIRHRNIDEVEDWELEFLCNIGASEILLPYGTFSQDVNNIKEPTLQSLLDLSNKYQASLEAVFLRFIEVVERPCAIIVGSYIDGKIQVDYYKSSSSYKFELPNDYIIPESSSAYEVKMPGWSSSGLEKWGVFGKKVQLYTIGLNFFKAKKSHRVGILIMPEYNEISLKKLYMVYGDATKPRGTGRKIIAQVVNTSAALGLGFGKSLAKNYPKALTELKKWSEDKGRYQLGNSNLVKVDNELFIFQMLAQKGIRPKDGEIPLKYSSLKTCLQELADTAAEIKASIHMPMIGAGQAKGDWNVISSMIHEEIVLKDIDVTVYVFPGKAYNPKIKSNLTLFDETSTYD